MSYKLLSSWAISFVIFFLHKGYRFSSCCYIKRLETLWCKSFYFWWTKICCRHLASGSGDTTVRFWDVNTETPHFTCKGKNNNLITLVPIIPNLTNTFQSIHSYPYENKTTTTKRLLKLGVIIKLSKNSFGTPNKLERSLIGQISK